MAAKKSPVAKKSKVAPAAVKKTTAASVKVSPTKKTPAKATPSKPTPSKPTATAVKPDAVVAHVVRPSPTKPKISPEQRWKLVAEAAYYLAEKRHFAAGHSEADWLTAERLVDAKLKS